MNEDGEKFEQELEKERTDAAWKRVLAAQHACMTGAGYAVEKDPKTGSPKNVRNGLDMAMVEHGAVVALLIKKGVFTRLEYAEALADATETEKARYEKFLSDNYGVNITLA